MSYVELFGPLLNEIRPRLFLGTMMAARDKALLQKHNISHILIVAANLTQHFPECFKYHQVSLADDESSDLLSHLPSCLQFMSTALAGGGSVLVHCAAGVSRSATVVISHLMATQRLSVDQAREEVRQRRPVICPNSGFMKQLHLFETMGCRLQANHPRFVSYRRELMNAGAA